eukprot:Gb_20924 [translate_table: standard]
MTISSLPRLGFSLCAGGKEIGFSILIRITSICFKTCIEGGSRGVKLLLLLLRPVGLWRTLLFRDNESIPSSVMMPCSFQPVDTIKLSHKLAYRSRLGTLVHTQSGFTRSLMDLLHPWHLLTVKAKAQGSLVSSAIVPS